MTHFYSPGFWMKPVVLSLALVCLGVVVSPAQVPEYFTLQGLVTDPGGIPITGYHSITVRLYDGSTEVYSETQAGTTTDGMFNMHIGPVDSVVFGTPLQFGITIDSDPEMPKEDLESVPYALGLRGLRVTYSTTTDRPPNLIGGSVDNTVDPDVWGVAIGGGGGYQGVHPVDPNAAEANYAVIGGGSGNLVGSGSPYAVIGGGGGNSVDASHGVIGGGSSNVIGGSAGTVGGGLANEAAGNFGTVPGGYHCRAGGYSSFAIGSYARANNDGSFVWQDATASGFDDSLSTFSDNQFRVRASGGFYFQTAPAPDLGTGLRLLTEEAGWETLSSRRAKKDFEEVDTGEVLRKLGDLDVLTWRYAGQELPIVHMGPVAEDFRAAFGLGSDDTHISTIDTDGVALAAIKGLYKIVKEQQLEIEELRRLAIANR